MKKTVKVLALALVAMSLTVACNNNASEPEVLDTMPVEEIEEPTIDTTVVAEEPAVEEVVTPAPTKKTTAKKEETKVTVDASKATLSNSGTSVSVSKDGVKVAKNGQESKVDASGVTLSGSKGSVNASEGGMKLQIKK